MLQHTRNFTHRSMNLIDLDADENDVGRTVHVLIPCRHPYFLSPSFPGSPTQGELFTPRFNAIMELLCSSALATSRPPASPIELPCKKVSVRSRQTHQSPLLFALPLTPSSSVVMTALYFNSRAISRAPSFPIQLF